ncbi:uncharacterized protein BDZ99DRAFT_457582 [Mytilinidion resinicola]|uniref:Aminoglycoside phosphotransferase domain-containing protein n=1 Tax=Mytilinidion resinicola TaxID=574789 RepID=A0A6A6Z3K4_9PEZI|nr:uncharacterized protein BDZ99DRAFT_457582 [Mytilinidion resinicola]KAF2815600.1 hypothetical protein BDZ99DRAFT_457582 [Mytilinidion resinicola]
MFCLMNPPIENSIVHTGQGRWLLGSSVVCETAIQVPKDALKSWKDDNGVIHCLREVFGDEDASIASRTCGSSESGRIHHAGTSAAVWSLGGAFIKVKAWRHGMQLESDTIRYVNRVSSVPTPEVVYSWVDTDWNRSFLVLKPLKGRTLLQAWETLSIDRRMELASTVARFCKTLALSTSKMLETANGKGIIEPFLTAQPPNSEPSWKPQFLGPYSTYQLQSYLSDPSVTGDTELFYFYHADLGPTNIIVTEDGSIVGIVDWESAAFYPMFWLGTKPLVSAGFFLHSGAERRAWAILLASSLEEEGFASDMVRYLAWKKAVNNRLD